MLDDLITYYRTVAEGKIISGDGFHSRNKVNEPLGTLPNDHSRPIVFEAVEEFSKKIGKNHLTFGNHEGDPEAFAFEADSS